MWFLTILAIFTRNPINKNTFAFVKMQNGNYEVCTIDSIHYIVWTTKYLDTDRNFKCIAHIDLCYYFDNDHVFVCNYDTVKWSVASYRRKFVNELVYTNWESTDWLIVNTINCITSSLNKNRIYSTLFKNH